MSQYTPKPEIILEEEDQIRRLRQELTVRIWTHGHLVRQFKKNPKNRPYTLFVAGLKDRSKARIKRLLTPLALWILNW